VEFGNRPLHLLETALRELDRRETEAAARAGDAVASIAASYFQAHKARVTALDFNPWRRALAVRQAREQVDPRTAEIFLELQAESRLPNWALLLIADEIPTLSLAANG